MTDHVSMTRRTVLSAATAGVGAAAIGATPALAQARKTFVLVHGAWHGGWCWRRVAGPARERRVTRCSRRR